MKVTKNCFVSVMTSPADLHISTLDLPTSFFLLMCPVSNLSVVVHVTDFIFCCLLWYLFMFVTSIVTHVSVFYEVFFLFFLYTKSFLLVSITPS